MKKINWPAAILMLLISGALIGSWIMMVLASTLTNGSHDSLILFQPTGGMIVITTFLMLGGITLLSIQVATIVERLIIK